ncbi:MAG: sugar nucleotide-binding protein [Gammaproteobacteria bacterium]|nr:sugar nucleotide-binding protein [Gammaproteobacteria bacterium]
MQKKLFVTGSSGVLGEPIVSQFEGKELITLYHHNKPSYRDVESFSGDISKPQFGLDNQAYDKLADSIKGIIHSAALTNFIQKKKLHRTNVQGTAEILKLARRADVPIFHISTAFVHPVFEKPDGDNLYVESKLAAEKLLQESGHPVSIIRPSIVTGDSTTGYMPTFQGFHETMCSFLSESMRVAVANDQGYIDIIPRDVVGKLIAEIIKQNIVNEEFWLSTGENAVSIKALIQCAQEVSVEMTGKKVRVPWMLSPTIYRKVIRPLLFRFVPRGVIQDIRRLEQLEGYFGTHKKLPSSLDELDKKWNIRAEYSEMDSLRRNVQWLFNTYIITDDAADPSIVAAKNSDKDTGYSRRSAYLSRLSYLLCGDSTGGHGPGGRGDH